MQQEAEYVQTTPLCRIVLNPGHEDYRIRPEKQYDKQFNKGSDKIPNFLELCKKGS